MAAERLPLLSDPADRFLAATAKVLDLALHCPDTRLMGLGEIATLANR
jgi:PIN domain nuclease of toxin-antitoxin system